MSTRRLARLRRLVTLPETRGLIIAAARSPTIRAVTHRVAHDRAGLVRDLRRPVRVRDLLLRGARHPAAGELASAGLLFLPGRYLPLGSAATWAARRILRRYIGIVMTARHAALSTRLAVRNEGPLPSTDSLPYSRPAAAAARAR